MAGLGKTKPGYASKGGRKSRSEPAPPPPPSQSGGTSGELSIPGYVPQTPTGTYHPNEPGHATQDFEAAFSAKEAHEDHAQAREEQRVERAEARQKRVVQKYVTKAYEPKKPDGPAAPFSIASLGTKVEHAKSNVSKVRDELLNHPAIQKANSEGKVVGTKGLSRIETSSKQSEAFKVKGPLTHWKRNPNNPLFEKPKKDPFAEAVSGTVTGWLDKQENVGGEGSYSDSAKVGRAVKGVTKNVRDAASEQWRKEKELGGQGSYQSPSIKEAAAGVEVALAPTVAGDIYAAGRVATKAGATLFEGGAKEAATEAASKVGAKAISSKDAIARIPGFFSRDALKASAKALPEQATSAAKSAPAAVGRSAVKGSERGLHSVAGISALGAANQAGLNVPGGAIFQGQKQAFEKDPLQVLSSTANLAPSLLVSAAQLPLAAGKSAIEGSPAPLEGALNEQKNFVQQFAKTYGSDNPKAIEQATLKEGLLPEVLLAPAVGRGLKELGKSSVVEKAKGAYRERRTPLTDETGSVVTDENGIPAKRGTQRHPNETKLTRGGEARHHRREEARHAGKTEDIVNVEVGRRTKAIEREARKAPGEQVTVRSGLGRKGKEKLQARSTDFIPFLNRAAIDLSKPEAALKEIQHYAETFKGQKSAAELGAKPSVLNSRDAVNYFLEHPEELKSKHLHRMLENYRDMANGKNGLASLSTSERNRYLGFAVAHDMPLPEGMLPHGARPLTEATDRARAWEDIKARDKEHADLTKRAREKKIEARRVPANTPEGKRIRREYKELYAKAKNIKKGREELHAELKDYTRPGAKPNRNSKRKPYDDAMEQEFGSNVKAEIAKRGLHPEPAYVPDVSAVARATPDRSATGGEEALTGAPQINEGYVHKHGLQVQGYEHLLNGVQRSVAAHHWYENARRFRTEHSIEYKGSAQHDSKEWAEAEQHGVINPKDVSLVPTQKLKRLERAIQGGTPSDYAEASAELTGAAVKASEAVPGTKYEAFPNAAYAEFVAQAQKAPVASWLRTANMVTSRAMLSTPSFVAAQVVAETAQAVADTNPARMAQGLLNYSKLSAEEKAKISGVSGETGKAIFSPNKLGASLANDGKPMKDALSFFRRNLFARSMKDIVSMKWAGDVNRVTSGFTRRAVLTGQVMRDLNGLQRHGRGLLHLQTELQKEIGHLSGKAQLEYMAKHPEALDQYHKKLGGAMGLFNNMTRTGHFPEVYRAAGLVFYPFLRMSVLWPLKYAVNHPIKATLLGYLAAQNNFALREALHGEPSFLNYAQVPLYGRNPKTGKLEATSTINLARMSPGGNAITQAIQGTGSPIGALQPVLGAAALGLTGQGSLGPVDGGVGAHLRAAGASVLSLSPYLRAIDTAAGQKASGQSEFGILAKRANIAVEPLSALEAKLKGPVGEQLFRSLGNPLQPQAIGRSRDQSKLGKVLGELGEYGSTAQSKVQATSRGNEKATRNKVVQMQKRYDKAKEELNALYKKHGLTKVAERSEAIYNYTHPYPGSTEKKSPFESSGFEANSEAFEGGWGGKEEQPPPFPSKGNSSLKLPGFNPGSVLGAVTSPLSSLIGGTPAQAAELPKGPAGKQLISSNARRSQQFRASEAAVNAKQSRKAATASKHIAGQLQEWGLDPEKVAVLSKVERETGVPAPLLASISRSESTNGTSTLPGVHGGNNFAGAAGPFQMGNGTGAAGNAWQTYSQKLWGSKASEHSVYDYADAARAAAEYLKESGVTKNPGTWYDGAFAYNHADWYANEVAGNARKAATLPWNQARGAGGDLVSGRNKSVYVRADAKGMVQWAKANLGTQEGSTKQLKWASKEGLGSSEPWCANFVSNGLARRGVTLPSNPNATESYEIWGREGKNASVVPGISKAKPGDVLTFSGEHTALYVGNGEMVSGNFSDEVERTPVSAHANLSMIIRPKYKGGKVKVKAGPALPSTIPSGTFSTPSGAPTQTAVAAYSASTGKSEKQVKKELKTKQLAPGALLKQVERIYSGQLPGGAIPGFSTRKEPDLQAIGRAVEESRRKLLAA